MTPNACLQGFDVSVAPEPRAFAPTPAEREARRLLCLHTPEDTARAEQVLSDVSGEGMLGEWYFLMGICALRRSHFADAQAHLDHACTLATPEAVSEYRTLYESVRNVFEKRRSADEDRKNRDHACCSAEDCCECCFCCDSDGDGICCEGPDGCCDCCDCSDGCN